MAAASGVSDATIKNIEHCIFIPRTETCEKIETALRNQGLEFTETGLRKIPQVICQKCRQLLAEKSAEPIP